MSPERLADLLKAHPRLTDPDAAFVFLSVGGGSVASGLVTAPEAVPPRLVLAGPDGLTLEFVPEDGAPKLDRVRKDGADLTAGGG